MKVLVTGGAGFIGSHIVEKLLENDFKVIVVDNLINGNKENLPNDVKFYHFDLLDKDIDAIFAKEKPSIVIHQAAQVSVQDSVNNPINDCRQNILATINLLEMCRKHKVSKIIYASTAAVYGTPQYLPIDENHPTNPISFYGLSKLTGEQYIKLYSDLFDIKYVILRYSNVYGKKQSTNGEAGVISKFISQISNNFQPIIFGDGNQTRDFIYVDDVAKANVYAIQTAGNNQIFNVSSNKEISINQVFKLLINITNQKIKCKYKESKKAEIMNSCLLNKKVKEELNWDQEYTLYEGLKETIDNYKKEK